MMPIIDGVGQIIIVAGPLFSDVTVYKRWFPADARMLMSDYNDWCIDGNGVLFTDIPSAEGVLRELAQECPDDGQLLDVVKSSKYKRTCAALLKDCRGRTALTSAGYHMRSRGELTSQARPHLQTRSPLN